MTLSIKKRKLQTEKEIEKKKRQKKLLAVI